ncbi:MAG: radical SAM protein [Bdellovibrionia bacterium]
MAHVTLIRGPVLFPKFRPSGVVNPVPPIGVAYLAGAVRVAGHQVTCIDAAGEGLDQFRVCPLDDRLLENGLSMDAIVARIPASSTVIAISCMFSIDWFYMLKLIRMIRTKFPSQFLIVGGEHVTADFEYILNTMPEVDACVLGEGENKFISLLEALESGVAKRDLPGCVVVDPETKAIRQNEEKDGNYRILDVDSIPWPAWDLLPLKTYLDAGHGHGSLHARAIPMLATRGCPHRCTFCSSAQMWTIRWKARDVQDVLKEIKHYIKEYGVNRIEFFDLTAIIDPRWIKEFCQHLIDENLGISWSMPSGTRTEALSQDVLELIKQSGCIKLSYPLETGNPKVNKLINKKINYAKSLGSMKNAVKAGIIVKTSIIIGFPFQTWGDILKEYLFAIRLAWIGSRDIVYYNFMPYPGSQIHNELVAAGLIVKDENYPAFLARTFPGNFTDGRSWCPVISGRALRMLCLFGIAQFYFFQFLFRPHWIFQSLYRMAARKPLTLLELGVTTVLTRFFQRLRSDHGLSIHATATNSELSRV